MKIAFILNDDAESNGGARPFINWSGFSDETKLVSFDAGINKKSDRFYNVSSISEAAEIVKSCDYIIVDDRNARLGVKIKNRINKRLAIYCQVPFGLHALGISAENNWNFKSLEYLASRYVPFMLLAGNHIRMLNEADSLVANSFAMHYLLNFVYGAPDKGIVHPPLDLEVFKTHNSVQKDSITVFVGREDDWNDYSVLPILEKIAEEKHLFLQFFGTKKVDIGAIGDRNNIIINPLLSEEELVRLYNRSYVTVSIQKQEFFGYVPLESVACGTPALTLYLHDASVLEKDLHKVVKQTSLKSIRDDISGILEGKEVTKARDVSGKLNELFSPANTLYKLKAVLEGRKSESL